MGGPSRRVGRPSSRVGRPSSRVGEANAAVIVARTRSELAEGLATLAESETREAPRCFVPTMGYLHEGHLSLVDRAREIGGSVVASVFVNPLQFGAGEDLGRYPRDEDRDLGLLEERDADLVFVPTVEDVYPDGEPSVTVDPGPMADVLCGVFRPGHFRGVLTVVAKLFGLVRPGVAVFGRKDYQQGVLIRRMVRDLELDVRIELAPVVREPDGLAMSSRNALLSADERLEAVELFRALEDAGAAFAGGERDSERLQEGVVEHLGRYPLLRPQYVEVVDPDTLEAQEKADRESVMAVAAYCGETRLIDNMVLGDGG